jgi:hypothetical protein
MLLRSPFEKSTTPARVPIAMALFSVGMMFTVFGIVWPEIVPPAAHASTDWHDFLRGLCYGLGVSFEVGGFIIAVTAVAAREKQLKKP